METQSRQELKRPDGFLTLLQRVWEFVLDNLRRVALIGAGVFVVVAAVIVWRHFAEQRSGDATALLGQALEQQAKAVMAVATDGGTEGDEFRTAAERCASVLGKLDQLDKQHSGSEVARAGGILRATCFLEAGRVEEAQKAYRSYLAQATVEDPVRPAAYEGLGYALERAGKYQDAIVEFRSMAQDEGSPYRDRALWHEARMLERLGKGKEAAAVFRAILEKFPATTLRDEITARSASAEASVAP